MKVTGFPSLSTPSVLFILFLLAGCAASRPVASSIVEQRNFGEVRLYEKRRVWQPGKEETTAMTFEAVRDSAGRTRTIFTWHAQAANTRPTLSMSFWEGSDCRRNLSVSWKTDDSTIACRKPACIWEYPVAYISEVIFPRGAYRLYRKDLLEAAPRFSKQLTAFRINDTLFSVQLTNYEGKRLPVLPNTDRLFVLREAIHVSTDGKLTIDYSHALRELPGRVKR